MPTATARATARTSPESTEPPAEHEDFSRMEAFGRAYARWLRALAQTECPISFDDEQFMKAAYAEDSLALRELFRVPADCSETVWAKLAVFEIELVKDQIVGTSKDSVLFLALGSIKADLANLGIGENA
jgi:hypothetical protein